MGVVGCDRVRWGGGVRLAGRRNKLRVIPTGPTLASKTSKLLKTQNLRLLIRVYLNGKNEYIKEFQVLT